MNDQILIYRWVRSGILFFLLAAILGSLMRYFYLAEIPFLDYKHLLHAHSHVALLGWGYMLVSGALIFLITGISSHRKIFRLLLALNIIATLGMLIFFLYQGYGVFSIAFSAIHIISVYIFAFTFLRDLKRIVQTPYLSFIRWGVYWLLFSTLGLWAIAPVSMLLGKLHPLYYASIQFFLHFQFNGWFTYAILGLWIYHYEKMDFKIEVSKTAFWLLQLSLLLTYALSITWSTPLSIIFYLNTAGVILQAMAIIMILIPIFRAKNPFNNKATWTDWLFLFGIICLVLKVAVQMAVAVPAIAVISYTIRNYVIGFIHLVMLGSVSFIGVSILLKHNILPTNAFSKFGWILLCIAFIAQEIMLFGQGSLLWMKRGFIAFYHEILFGITAILPLALLLILTGIRRSAYKELYIEKPIKNKI